MALQPIPLKLCDSSSLHFLVLRSQSHASLNFRVSCSNQTAEPVKVATKKKKSSSRPSFFDQIRDKWSLKLDSQREKFPWQEQEQEQEQDQVQEQEECEHKSPELNFRFPKRFSPWPQAERPTNPKIESESEHDDNGKPLRHRFGGSVIEEKRNEMASESVRKRRSKTELAERLIAEHELRRLRNIALRMMERFRVGVTGITQELVASIHEKWRDNEVVKLKFEPPLSANMTKAHQILEVPHSLFNFHHSFFTYLMYA